MSEYPDPVARLTPDEKRDILAAAVPRLPAGGYIPQVPTPPQSVFMLQNRLEVFYGGAAGGGKSSALLAAALQYVDVPGYSALILRRTFADLRQRGALLDRASTWLSGTDATPKGGGTQWVFPSTATLSFGHVQNHKEAEQQYSSAEFQFIGIDELTQGWEERTYKFLFTRIRRPVMACRLCSREIEWVQAGIPKLDPDGIEIPGSAADVSGWRHVEQVTCETPTAPELPSAPDGTTLADVPNRMRSASNPGGTGHLWVKERLVDPRTRAAGALFVPAKLDDNPHVDRRSYRGNLEMQDPVLAARLLGGDWDVVDEGLMFQRGWITAIDESEVPARTEWVRYWDLASGAADGDWTAGALVGLHRRSGTWYIRDVVRTRERPLATQERVVDTAEADQKLVAAHVPIYVEQEPGSSGVFLAETFTTLLAGYEFVSDPATGKKEERARPFSAAAEAGRVRMIGAQASPGIVAPPHWARRFLDELELFPFGEHDDQVDAVTGAMKALTKPRKRRSRVSSAAGRSI